MGLKPVILTGTWSRGREPRLLQCKYKRRYADVTRTLNLDWQLLRKHPLNLETECLCLCEAGQKGLFQKSCSQFSTSSSSSVSREAAKPDELHDYLIKMFNLLFKIAVSCLPRSHPGSPDLNICILRPRFSKSSMVRTLTNNTHGWRW